MFLTTGFYFIFCCVKFGKALIYISGAGHPWIRNTNDVKVPLDILIFKLMKAYMRSSALRKAALRVCIFVLIFSVQLDHFCVNFI